MKNFNLFGLFFTALLTAFSFSAVSAQVAAPADAPNESGAANRRADLLDELGLTPEQRRRFRSVNSEQRPAIRAAQQRLREATRALDEAVYSDALDEPLVQTRIKETQAAQAEVIRIRTMTEFAVRRILTAEQLTRFREARRRFEAAVEERRASKKENRMLDAPNRRFGNRRRRATAPPNN